MRLWLNLTFGDFGVDVDDNGIILTAPDELKRWRGKPYQDVVSYYYKKGKLFQKQRTRKNKPYNHKQKCRK